MRYTREIVGAMTQTCIQIKAALAFLSEELDSLSEGSMDPNEPRPLADVKNLAVKELVGCTSILKSMQEHAESVRTVVGVTASSVDDALRAAKQK